MASLKILSQLLRRADWGALTKADILAVRHDGDCGQLIDGKYYAPMIDSLLDEVRRAAVLTIASPYSFRVGAASHAGALSFNGAFVRELLVRRLRRMLGVASDQADIGTWRRVVKAVQPRYVIGIQPPAALCRACHEQGVFVFDMQHGYIGPKHPGYGEAFQIGRDRQEMADCILCWDEDSAASIRDWTARKQIEVRVIGNPWINKFVARRREDKVIRFFEDRRGPDWPGDARPRILVSLQWGLDDPALTPDQALFDNEFMPMALEAAIQRTREQYHWILRPHPVQSLNPEVFKRLTAHVKERFESSVRISDNDPLPFVLSGVDLHITYNSSVVIEAECFGVRSALLDPQIGGGLWAGYYATQIDKGIADRLPCEVSAIEEWIRASRTAQAGRRLSPSVPQAYTEFLEQLEGR